MYYEKRSIKCKLKKKITSQLSIYNLICDNLKFKINYFLISMIEAKYNLVNASKCHMKYQINI